LGLVDKVFTLSHPKFHGKNLKFIIETVLNNNYPIDFIFSNINQRIKYILHNVNKNSNSTKNNSNFKRFLTVPYIKTLYNQIKLLAKKHDLQLAFSITNNFIL